VKGEKWDVDSCCGGMEWNGEDWIGWTRFGGHLSWDAAHDKTFFAVSL
jgi:hypothetical protein